MRSSENIVSELFHTCAQGRYRRHADAAQQAVRGRQLSVEERRLDGSCARRVSCHVSQHLHFQKVVVVLCPHLAVGCPHLAANTGRRQVLCFVLALQPTWATSARTESAVVGSEWRRTAAGERPRTAERDSIVLARPSTADSPSANSCWNRRHRAPKLSAPLRPYHLSLPAFET